jgi:3-dehydroquinate dehydratase/shikimate dehydrogenase
MICVTIGRGRHRHLIAEHKFLAEQGAQLVELRIDMIQGPVNLKRLLENRPCPAVITCRRQQDGGKWSGSEEDRQMLLRTAIASGVEWVDLEEDIAAKIPRFGKTKRIVSYHSFKDTPANLAELHERMRGLGADVVKIATMANRPHDNVRMLELIKNSPGMTVGLCMGDIGTPSRILAGKFGAPFTYAAFQQERVLAPGQLTYQQMLEVYHYNRIYPDTEVFGVIGDPIGHSMSPVVHNAAFRQCAMNRIYVPFRVQKDHLSSFVDDAPALGIKGLSVTIPHKELVVKKLTYIDDDARDIKAVNTVVFDQGQIRGYNTDYRAAIDSLEEAMGGADQPTSPVAKRVALVLGAGGAAKAVAHSLFQRDAEVLIASRRPEQAVALAKAIGCRTVDWHARHGVAADILVNCTPVGMHPNVDEAPFDRHSLKPSMVVFDTIYNPENTLLIKEARNRNCTIVTGVDMFIRQAGLQFKLFTGSEPPLGLMREALKRALSAAKY